LYRERVNPKSEFDFSGRKRGRINLYTFALASFIIAVAPWHNAAAQEGNNDKFLFLADTQFFLTISNLDGGSNILGGNANATLAPTYRLNDKNVIIGLYSGAYAHEKQAFVEDRGSRIASETMTNSLTPTLRHEYSDKLTLNVLAFRTQVLSKETTDENWYKGLYDYNDNGGGFNGVYIVNESDDEKRTVSFGLQYYKREYPHFISLYTQAGLGDLEEKEKDQNAMLLIAGYDVIRNSGLSYSLSVSQLAKSYIDKKIELETGERSGDKQKDTDYLVSGSFSYRKEGSVSMDLDWSVGKTESNQNLAEGTLPNIVFHKNYYGNDSYSMTPGLTYSMMLENGKPLTLKASVLISRVTFTERLTRDANGVLTDIKELDNTHMIMVGAYYSVNDNLTTGFLLNHLRANSNNQYETFYRYNYEILNVSAGIQYHY